MIVNILSSQISNLKQVNQINIKHRYLLIIHILTNIEFNAQINTNIT